MEITAIVPGTFDPITLGHVDLIKRAQKLFSNIIVAIADSGNKKPVFSIKQRQEVIAKIFAADKNVMVKNFSGLLVNFAKENKATVVVRGLRAIADYEFELQMANANYHLNPEIETLYLTSRENHSYISSSLVKEVASFGGDVSSFVSPEVATMLQQFYTRGQ